MSHLGDKISGKVKENVGWAIGDKSMEARGKAQATEAATLREGDQHSYTHGSSTTGTNEPGRMHGNMEAAKGSVKQNVGHAVGNRTMEAHGEEQYSAGQAENRAAKNMNQAKGMGEQTTGATKQYTGQALGNERMQAEGQGRRLQGQGRENLNL